MAQAQSADHPPPPPLKRRRDDTHHHRPAKHKRPSAAPVPSEDKMQITLEAAAPPLRMLPQRCHVCSRAQSIGFGTITVCGACARGTCYVCTRRCDGCAETVCSGCCEERGVQCFCGRCVGAGR
ncbi:uncharacterized protein H6S33_002150 [Morchella sextelata]|uniref:uncharacterized protein n=1 Tax=Morchella sextelata TaxID=1174677 RepID=UPI001D04E1C4|nr:uncharacterized protein H6S33_002150 [Morchella sextelata]KAH0608098.1 hypothetical protein H6S33_002150 [Morchella sextelata]